MIEKRDDLLWQFARKLAALEKRYVGVFPVRPCPPMINIKVTFYDENDEVLVELLGATQALGILVDDIYRDEEHDWSKAVRLEMDTY
jgi:hypothetical protein